MSFKVTVIRVPGAVREVYLDENTNTVADAIRLANFTVDNGEHVAVNGENTNMSRTLCAGDRIAIVKGAKGNQ